MYASVKAVVLKACELVPEAYCQRFKCWEKSGKQMHMEFARELVTHFNCWCTSLGVHTYSALCNLIVLEQFKNSVPSHITTYLNERKVKTAIEAASLADEYVLTYKQVDASVECSLDQSLSSAFVSDGHVSLVGRDVKVQVIREIMLLLVHIW